jgi:ERCC4-type nuclease
MTKLLIDNREIHFTEIIKEKENYNSLNIEYQQLEIGDFIIENNSLVNIIERKTIEDFQRSIVDGRYRDQKKRLLEYRTLSEKKVTIIYLIEGTINQISKKYEKIFWGMIVNSILRDDIHIIQSPTLAKSVEIIINMYEKIVKEIVNNEEKNLPITMTTTGFKKSDYITPNTCYKAQLCQVPGISIKIAEAISDMYNSFPKLVNEFINLEKEERIKKLSEILIVGTNSKRKLGKKKAEKIMDNIFF